MLGEIEAKEGSVELQNILALRLAAAPYDLENLKSVLSIYFQLGMYDNASDVALTMIKLDPDNPEYLKNFNLARLEFLKSLAADSHENNSLFKQIADLSFELEQWEEAINWYKKSDKSDHSYRLNMAEAYYNVKSYDMASMYYTLSCPRDSDGNLDISISLKIADCYTKNKAYHNAALKATEVLLQDPKNIHAIEFLTTSFFELNEYKKALNIASLGMTINPENMTCINIAAKSYAKLGEYDQALVFLDKYLVANSSDALDINLEKGSILLKQNNLTEAVVSFNKAAAIANTSDSSVFECIANQLMLYGHHLEARLFAERGLERDPDNIEIKAILSKAVAVLGDFDMAEHLAKEVFVIDIRSEEALCAMMHICLHKGNQEDVRNLLDRLIEIDPNNLEYRLAHIMCMERIGDPRLPDYIEYIKNLFRIKPQFSDDFKGKTCSSVEYFGDSTSIYKIPTIFDRQNAYVSLNIVHELIEDNKLQEALILWNKVINVIPTYSKALIEGINLHIKLKAYEQAEELILIAKDHLKINYSNALREQMAIQYCQTGRYDIANAVSEEVVAPKNKAVWYSNLGTIFLHLGGDSYEFAIDQYSEATDIASKYATIYSNLIELLGRWSELNVPISEEYKEEISGIFQERIAFYQQIGMESLANSATALNALGEYDEAIEAANAALVFDPAHVHVPTLVNLFTSYRAKSYNENDYQSLEKAYNVCNELILITYTEHPLHAQFTSERDKILLDLNTMQEAASLVLTPSSGYDTISESDDYDLYNPPASPDPLEMLMGEMSRDEE